VAGKLRLDWSPEQIAGWLKRTHPEDECNQVSHETIYRSLFVQTRGVLKKELLSHLRSKRSMRRSKPVDPNGDRRGHIKDIVSIRQRPAAVEDRAVPGHWEGDLLSGPNNSYIATLVERHTRYAMLAKVAGKDTQTVVSALIKQAKKLPKELYKSLTWDRGKELTDHRRFTWATKIDVYFCDPQSPWQRGSNENTNGLGQSSFRFDENGSGRADHVRSRVQSGLYVRDDRLPQSADTVAKLPKCHAIISRKLTKRAAIADRCSLQAIAEVACEFIADYVVPQMIIRSPRVHPGTLVLVDTKRLLQQYLPGPEFSPLHSHP
jgi:Integrase core domain